MRDSFWAGVAGQAEQRDKTQKLDAERKKLLAHWAASPENWLWGHDLDGRNLIWTTDERDPFSPVKALPDYQYLRRWVYDINNPATPFVLLDKPRQMMVSWITLLYLDWLCRFQPSRRVLFSKTTRDEAIEMLLDKVRAVHKRLPEWVQDASPQTSKPANRVRYPATDSYILAVGENAAERAMRGGTSSKVFVDEAARQDFFAQIYAAARPMCEGFIAVTTPKLEGDGAKTFRKFHQEGLEDAA